MRGARIGLLAAISLMLMHSRAWSQLPSQGRVYVILWFDTEDYILPQSDDAAKRLAAFLTQQGIRATFKVVGEKARVLENRGRRDVIGALAQHEIGYHTDTHSQHPTVAEYEAVLDWASGIDEFTRRERAGFDDVKRIFGQAPTCYGQPGASWAPQPYAALRKWGVKVYLDEGTHVGLEGKPFWYGGLLNVFNIAEGAKLHPNQDWSNFAEVRVNFEQIYLRLSERGGGIVSLYFHPCEFVHREFWDGVNFAHGANPARDQWQLPPLKAPEESERAFRFFEELVAYMKSLPRVEFITASQALELFRDTAARRVFSREEIGDIAQQVSADVSFQMHREYALSAAEVFEILTRYVAGLLRRTPSEPILLDGILYGPSSPPVELADPIEVPWSEYSRAVLDVADFIKKAGRVPNAVWLGSRPVPPESYLVTLAQVTVLLLTKGEPPETVTIAPARLAAAQHVADDALELWDWIVFPAGFRAPTLMTLAKLQAWTLKPARPIG